MTSNFLGRHIFTILFIMSFSVLHIGGELLNGVMLFYGIDKVEGGDFYGTMLPMLFLFIFIISYVFFNIIVPYFSKNTLLSDIDDIIIKLSFGIFTIALLIYISKSGLVLFSDGGYINRYEKNLGLGVVTQLLIFFYFGFSIWLRKKVLSTPGTMRDMLPPMILGVMFCIVTFLALGGHRQLGFGVFFVIGLLLYEMKKLSRVQLITLSVFAVSFLTLSAVFRYDVNISSFGDLVKIFAIYTFDGLTPIDAYYNIYNYVSTYGPEDGVLSNLFLSLIPRTIWSEKPEIMMNAGNVYTQFILGRVTAITYSPTMLGELLLIHGLYFVPFLAPALAFVMVMLNRLVATGSRLGYIFLSLSPLLVFNLYREGFYVMIKRIILYLIFIAFIFLIARILNTLRHFRFL